MAHVDAVDQVVGDERTRKEQDGEDDEGPRIVVVDEVPDDDCTQGQQHEHIPEDVAANAGHLALDRLLDEFLVEATLAVHLIFQFVDLLAQFIELVEFVEIIVNGCFHIDGVV